MSAPLRRRTSVAFIWVALIPVALTLVALWLSRQFQGEVAWIKHTADVRSTVREGNLFVWNAERDLRNYILTGQDAYLAAMKSDGDQTSVYLEQLRRLTADNPRQQANVARLKQAVEEKLADLVRNRDLRVTQGVNAAMSPEEVDRGQRLMEQVRNASRTMMEEEERLLVARSKVESRTNRAAEIIFALAIGLTFALLFRARDLAKQYAGKRDLAEEALQQKVREIEALNEDLEKRVAERTAEVRLLASIVESSDDAILAKSTDGTIESWNSGAQRLYGYTPDEIIGRDVHILVPPDRMGEEEEIQSKIRLGERVEHFETTRLRKGGLPVDVSLTISPILDKSGQVVGASHVARDITEQKRSAEILRQTQKLESLGILAGGIAHDFNNLLVGILGNASLALDQLTPSSPARGAIQDLVTASERAAVLTRQMLAYSGRGHFVLERIDLSTYVRETVPLIQAAIPRTVELRLDLADALPPVRADMTQIQQLVMNLVINGAEAVPEGRPGTVTVSTRREQIDEVQTPPEGVIGASELTPGGYVSLEVRDTGGGMDERTKARIFDPFFTTKFTGRGLGLAAVLGIVRGHGGCIQVSSTPHQGTSFRVLFPALCSALTLRTRAAEEPRDLNGWGTILVIDDEQTVAKMAKQVLEYYGYEVLLAENGATGVELFREHADRIQCVLLDMTMPVMSGEEVLPHLKAIRGDVPVVLSSGFGEAEAVSRFEGKGLAGFIQKPYKATTLAAKIREAVVSENPALRATGS